jgi:hypothetical protein
VARQSSRQFAACDVLRNKSQTVLNVLLSLRLMGGAPLSMIQFGSASGLRKSWICRCIGLLPPLPAWLSPCRWLLEARCLGGTTASVLTYGATL